MKAQFATLAIAALALWLIPSVGLGQGNSGKSRLTICHISPGNSDARRTLTIAESAWSAHESHGDFLGPCDEYSDGHGDKKYGADDKRAKKSKQRKKRKEPRSGSDRGDSDDEVGGGDRAARDRETDQTDSGSDESGAREADERAKRDRRHAERRDRRVRDQSDPRIEADQAGEAAASDDAGKTQAGGAEVGTDGAEPAEARGGRKARAGERNPRGMQPAAGTDAAPEAEPGFFRGVQQFFGFGEDADEQPSGDAAE